MAVTACAASVAIGVIGFRSTRDRLIDEVDRSIADAVATFDGRPVRNDRFPTRGLLEVFSLRQLGPAGNVARSSFLVDVPVTDGARLALNSPGVVVRESVETASGELRVHTYGRPVGALQAARSLDEAQAVLDDLQRRTAFVVALVSIAAALAGLLIAGSVAAPLRRLTRAASEVEATGRLDVEVPQRPGRDEVGVLGRSLAGMLGALARSREQQRRLVQDAGHELRTPLTSLRTNLAVLRRHDRLEPAMAAAILDDLDSEVNELTELVDELVAAASGTLADQPAERVDLAVVARSVAERVGRRRQRAIEVVTTAGASVVLAPPAGLDRAVANLVDNACKFDTSDTPIEVAVDGGSLRVRDRGPGIPDADLPFVFDRFHRAEAARSAPGSGLGLAIVRELVERHGGTVSAQNRPDGGADVGFVLPTAPTV